MQLNDLTRLTQAATRFADQVPVTDAKPVDKLAKRRKTLLDEGASRDKARVTVLEAEAHGAIAAPEDTLRRLGRERIIGSNDIVDINYLELAFAMGRAVARLRVGGASATGFLVGPRLLLTNHHVIETREEGAQALAQFDFQDSISGDPMTAQVFALDPAYFFVTDRALDFTLIGVTPQSRLGASLEDYPWVPLIERLGKAEKGDPVNIIQHPRGGTKQIALRNNEILEIPEGKSGFLYYSTDTEPGSSGSPCFNNQWELIALHHSGVPRLNGKVILQKNGKPWRDGVDDPALIDWIANEGARVSAIGAAIRAATLEAAQDELRAQIFELASPNPVELARKVRVGGAPLQAAQKTGVTAGVGAQGGSSQVTLQVPLTITISLGAPQGATAPQTMNVPVPAAGVEPRAAVSDSSIAAEELAVDPDWKSRKGADPDFLNFRDAAGKPLLVPLPALSAALRENTVEVPDEFRRNGDKFALHYHHYSVAMSKSRFFAWYSAADIDGKRRPKLPKRKNDKWHIDERIDDRDAPEFQCGEELYKTDRTDRGHLTRYLDLGWGDTLDEALNAMADSFHFTNCCLQLSNFNQSKDRWQGIEQYLLEHKARKEERRMKVITGPLFEDSDPIYQNPFMDYRLAIPVQFWKVCVLKRENGTIAATAFIMGQKDITKLPGFEEKFDVLATQVTIAELEDRTGLSFGMLKKHDHFASGGGPGVLEVDRGAGKRPVKAISDVEDIVI